MGGLVCIFQVFRERRKARTNQEETFRQNREERRKVGRREGRNRRNRVGGGDDNRSEDVRKESSGIRDGRKGKAKTRMESMTEVEMQNQGGDRARNGQSGIQRRDFAYV